MDTLEAALLAAGQSLDMRVRRQRHPVDESQIVERLKLTPAERLATFRSSSGNLNRLLAKAPPRHRRVT